MTKVVITGIGLVSCQGEGRNAHLNLSSSLPVLDTTRFAPYPVHPVATLSLDSQIPKKSDQRQMEPWQRLGCYAAGLALDEAGLKDNPTLKSQMHLIVAAGGGERDYEVDCSVLTGLRHADNPDAYLNERLMSDVRPTLFLAQLSNLLAGNISIVHGVTGASRTFMGEEQAGVDALRIAHARIKSGQNDIILVGGSYNAERPDVLLIYEMGGYLWTKPYQPVFAREGEGGFILGSAGAFLVLESEEHALKRGVTPVAVLEQVFSDQPRRLEGSVEHNLSLMIQQSGVSDALVVSGATGLSDLARQEQKALSSFKDETVMALGDIIGHSLEAQFCFGVGLAALKLQNNEDSAALVTSVGHRRGEGLAVLKRYAS